MGDVHEELQLSIGHFLGMDMLLQAQTVLLLTLVLPPVPQEQSCQRQNIHHVCESRAIPRGVYHDLETALRRLDAVLLCHHAEVIVTKRKMAKRNVVDTWRHTHPLFFVDTVAIDDMFRAVIGQRRQLDAKAVVTGTQHKLVGSDDGGVHHLPESRHGGRRHGLSIHSKACQLHFCIPFVFVNL